MKPTEWDIYFNKYSKRLQNSRMVSLKESFEKSNKNLKTKEVPKKKKLTDITLLLLIILYLSTHSSNPLPELSFHYEEIT